jgi:hypothetical protein
MCCSLHRPLVLSHKTKGLVLSHKTILFFLLSHKASKFYIHIATNFYIYIVCYFLFCIPKAEALPPTGDRPRPGVDRAWVREVAKPASVPVCVCVCVCLKYI